MGLADQAGALQTSYTYTPFAKATSSGPSSSNSFQFTGRENDGTGLQYKRARYYHPTFGRFISEDPLGFAAGDANLYGYVGNSPVNLTDPSGMSPVVVACLGGAAFDVGFTVVGAALAGRKVSVGDVLGSAAMGCASSLAGFGLGKVAGKVLGRVANSADEVGGFADDIVGAACSFSGETQVLMADGSMKAISQIRVGDFCPSRGSRNRRARATQRHACVATRGRGHRSEVRGSGTNHHRGSPVLECV